MLIHMKFYKLQYGFIVVNVKSKKKSFWQKIKWNVFKALELKNISIGTKSISCKLDYIKFNNLDYEKTKLRRTWLRVEENMLYIYQTKESYPDTDQLKISNISDRHFTEDSKMSNKHMKRCLLIVNLVNDKRKCKYNKHEIPLHIYWNG